MLVNLDEQLNMRDLYYPRVGMTNHILGHKNRMGVWVNGAFDWVDSPDWARRSGYEEESLIGLSTALNTRLAVSLFLEDAVDFRNNIYVKKIRIVNLASHEQEVRLFFTHDFCIDESDIGDTSLYDPGADAIIHYKRDKWFLMSGQSGSDGIFEYANGTKRFQGAEGTWRDAEDGRLEGNPIAQGSVDSSVSFRVFLPEEGEVNVNYWIAAGSNLEEVRHLHRMVRRRGVEAVLKSTRAYWRSWLGKKQLYTNDLSDEASALFKRSLLIVRTQIDRDGGIIAANDSDILHFNRDDYSYVWPRDGALVALSMAAAGYPESVKPFFRFCERGLSSGGYMWHKYHPDGSLGSSWHPWVEVDGPLLPIQEDETALVLYALWHVYKAEKEIDFVQSLYFTLIRPAADFMVSYRDPGSGLPHESYDLWEERRGIFTFTATAVWAGLVAASRFASLFGESTDEKKYAQAAEEVREGILSHLYDAGEGRFLRGIRFDNGEVIKDMTVESSVYAVHAFGLLPADDHRVVSSIEAIERELSVQTSVGGVARYENDGYFAKMNRPGIPGNPWIICTLWIADWYVSKARTPADLEPAKQLIEWTVGRAAPTGILPEQLHPETGAPLSVAPLTWSHSTYVHTVVKYAQALERINRSDAIREGVWVGVAENMSET